MDPILGGLLAGGASLLGSVFNTQQNNQNSMAIAQQQNAFNQSQTEGQELYNTGMVANQQAYETSMSNTAYQRAQTDMKAAGLNPIAMAGGGASTPSSSVPGVSTPNAAPMSKSSAAGSVGPAIDKAISTAIGMKTADATINNLVQQNANLVTENELNKSRTDVESARFAETNARTSNITSDTRIKDAMGDVTRDEALSARNRSGMNSTVRMLMDQAGFAGRKVGDTLSPITNLISSARQVGLMTGKGY